MLDENGLKIPTYAQLLEDMESKSRELFGENVNLNPQMPLGLIIRIFAWFLAIIWQVVESVYHSSFVKSSEGVQLDRHGKRRNISRNPASESTTYLTVTGEPFYTVEIGTLFETESGIQFLTIYELTLDETGQGTVEAVSVERGSFANVPAESIRVISEPVAELYTVNNAQDAAGGANQESDASYRERLIQGNVAQNNATVNALYSKLTNINGVVSVKVNVNDRLEEVNGIPPKSINAMVVGGNNDDIGQVIFETVAGGVGTSGDQSYIATALDGNQHEIRFSKAISQPLHARIVIQVSEEFPIDGETRLKDAVIQYIGGDASDGTHYNGLDLSEELIYTKLFHAVYSIPGVENAAEVLVGTSPNDLKTGNVIPDTNSVLMIAAEDIEVITNVG